MERDCTGAALWWGFLAGAILAAAGYGDETHLRSLLFAGVILACASLIALVIRWGFRRQVPGSVTPITDAPTALELAASNERRVEELELRSDIQDDKVRTLARVLRTAPVTPGGAPADPDGTGPLPGLPLISLPGGRGRGGIQAGLCPVAGAPLSRLLGG